LYYFYLAMTGGVVVVPDAETVIDTEGESCIRVTDAAGRVLVIFNRRDVSLYARKPLAMPQDREDESESLRAGSE
jgi:hypothetical protein